MKYNLEKLNVGQLTGVEVAGLMTRVVTDYRATPPLSPRAENSILKSYLEALEQKTIDYDKVVNRVMKNADTELLAAKDARRDRALAALFKYLKVPLGSDDAQEAEAARRLNILMDVYREVARMNYEAESKSIDTLVSELTGSNYAPYVTLLGAGRYVERLRVANEEFKALFTSRINTEAMTETFDSYNMRLALLDYYREFTIFLLGMANATQEGVYVDLLAKVNAGRNYYSDILAHRRGVTEAQQTKDAVMES